MRLGAAPSGRQGFEKEPAESLREMARELEHELETVTARLSIVAKDASDAEASAMGAIRKGDDQAARAALIDQQAFVGVLAELEADANVLRSLLGEIRKFLQDLDPAAGR